MGAIGYVMAESGLEDLWGTVFAHNSVPYMVSGHAHSRALSAHLSTSAAVFQELVKDENALGTTRCDELTAFLQECTSRDHSTYYHT